MARFIVRIELRGNPSWDDYDTLHAAMEAAGFSRVVVSDAGVAYHLPHAEYCLEATLSLQQVVSRARNAAAKTGKPYAVLATQSSGMVWSGLVSAKSA